MRFSDKAVYSTSFVRQHRSARPDPEVISTGQAGPFHDPLAVVVDVPEQPINNMLELGQNLSPDDLNLFNVPYCQQLDWQLFCSQSEENLAGDLGL